MSRERNTRISRDVTTYGDGSRTIEDVTQDKNGILNSHIYNISKDNKTHDHVHQTYDGKNLKYEGGHGEEPKKWRDMFYSKLAQLSFIELQYLETVVDNDYIKRSIRYFMNCSTSNNLPNEIELEKPFVKTLNKRM